MSLPFLSPLINWLSSKRRRGKLYRILPSVIIGGLVFWHFTIAQETTDLTFDNPIGAKDFTILIQSIAESVIKVGVPLAVLALVFAAFQFVSGSLSDNPGKIKQAKQVFWFTLIGVAILVGAWAIATAVVNFAKEL